MKRGNPELILTVKIIEYSKVIDYYGIIIEANPSRVDKKNVYFPPIGSLPNPSPVQSHLSMYHVDKELNLELPKLRLYQPKNIAAEILPRIYSALIDLGVVFVNLFLY